MKQIFTIAASMMVASAYSQTTKQEKIADAYFPKNEIKVNIIYPISGIGEISYERSLSKHSSVGISAYMDFKESKKSFFILPYYRYYFGETGKGFYLEGQTIIGKSNDRDMLSPESANGKLLFGVGGGGGYKFVMKNNWFFDANITTGSFLNENKALYFKPGLSFGKRF